MIRHRTFPLIVLILMMSIFSPSYSQSSKKLTYAQVFNRAEPRLFRELPNISSWLDDQSYLESRSGQDRSRGVIYRIDAATGQESVYFDPAAAADKLPKGFNLDRFADRTADYDGYILSQQQDLYYYCASRSLFKRLTASPAEEKTPHFSPDGRRVAFTRDNDLYVLDIDSGLERRLTTDGSSTVYNGWASWVYYEEVLGRSSRYCAFWWSPDSRSLAFMRFDDSRVPEFTIFDADGVHGRLEVARYPKAGDPNPQVRIGVVEIDSAKITWVADNATSDDYLAWPMWTADSRQLVYQRLNRGQDHLSIEMMELNSGAVKKIYDETNPAWVEFFEDLYLFADGSGLLMRSSADGWPHLYYYDLSGKLRARLTRGEWTVKKILRVDEKGRTLFFAADKEGSTENDLYRVQLDGKGLQRLTQGAGTHTCIVSPSGRYFIDTYQNFATPRAMTLRDGAGKTIRPLVDSRLPVLQDYALGKAELFRIPAEDGLQLPAAWVLPPDFDPGKKYPVVLAVYGGPNNATVSDRFPDLDAFYMAQCGIINISVDHRGSGHLGKQGVVLMHRNLGKWEMRDYISVVKWLRRQPFVDSARIGITGGSYGGFVTALALTYGADYFTHGIAEYSVTDYRLYDSIYTERYMDLPSENPEGYDFTCVAKHADKYRGHLLIVHGTLDDNVHMQNSIQLIDALQDLNKDFEMQIYPNERHGVRPPKSRHLARTRMLFWMRHFFNQDQIE